VGPAVSGNEGVRGSTDLYMLLANSRALPNNSFVAIFFGPRQCYTSLNFLSRAVGHFSLTTFSNCIALSTLFAWLWVCVECAAKQSVCDLGKLTFPYT